MLKIMSIMFQYVSTNFNADAPVQLCRPWIICNRICVHMSIQLTRAGLIIRQGKAVKPWSLNQTA